MYEALSYVTYYAKHLALMLTVVDLGFNEVGFYYIIAHEVHMKPFVTTPTFW